MQRACRSARRPALHAADRRRRPRRADPRAADLGRDRHHRHARGLRHATSAPTSPARSSAQRKAPMVAGAVICCFALVPGAAEAPVPVHRRRRSSAAGIRDARRAVRLAQATRPRRQAALARRRAGRGARAARRRAGGAAARPARAGDRLRAGAARRPRRPAARCCSASRRCAARSPPSSASWSRRCASTTSVGAGLARVRGEGARHRGRARAAHRRPPARAGPRRRGRAARGGVPTTEPAFGLPATWIADGPRAEAEALGYTVVDAESVIVTHLTETIRGHAAELLTPPGRQTLLDSAQGVERRGGRGGRARPAVARRDPARAAVAAGGGRLDPRPRRDRRGGRRQGAA